MTIVYAMLDDQSEYFIVRLIKGNPERFDDGRIRGRWVQRRVRRYVIDEKWEG